jgi:PP-loop superfamily ATP-utilizing enzyme
MVKHNPNIKVEAKEMIKKSLIQFGVKAENIATYNQYTYNNKEDLDIACNMKAKEKGTKIFKRDTKQEQAKELLEYLNNEKARSQSPKSSLQARLSRAPEGVDSQKMEIGYL